LSDIIQNTINSVLGDAARPSKYKLNLSLPSTFETDKDRQIDVVCKAVNFPPKSSEVIFVKHKGRNIPIPGQERFGHTFDCTFYLDEQHTLRNLFIHWIESLNFNTYLSAEELHNTTAALKSKQSSSLIEGKTTAKLIQLNFDADIETSEIEFYHVFPREISGVQTDSSQVAQISEFTVTFSYSYFKIQEKTKEGSNSNDIAGAILGEVQNITNKVVSSAMGYIPGLDKLNSVATTVNESIQETGRSIATGIEDFLG